MYNNFVILRGGLSDIVRDGLRDIVRGGCVILCVAGVSSDVAYR